jgi:hypothetical protein
MADRKLVLHPANPWAILQDPPALVERLREIGLVGASFPHMGELHHRPGLRFQELVLFRPESAGGSTPPSACHVSVIETAAEPVFLGGSNAQPPSCPACRTKFQSWTTLLRSWQEDKRRFRWPCRSCNKAIAIEQLDWNRTGGIARYSVEVWEVGEGEAGPSPELMRFLEEEMKEPWRHFFYRF